MYDIPRLVFAVGDTCPPSSIPRAIPPPPLAYAKESSVRITSRQTVRETYRLLKVGIKPRAAQRQFRMQQLLIDAAIDSNRTFRTQSRIAIVGSKSATESLISGRSTEAVADMTSKLGIGLRNEICQRPIPRIRRRRFDSRVAPVYGVVASRKDRILKTEELSPACQQSIAASPRKD